MFLNKLKEHVQPHILDSTPNVLSLGRRVIVDGYSFEWPARSHSPWLVHPTTGEKIHLEVRDFVPYLVVPPTDAELREPWTRDSWVAAPSLTREQHVADMEDFQNAVDSTPVARTATAAPGPGTGASSSSGSGDKPADDDASLRSLATGASPGDREDTEASLRAPLPPPPAPHKAARPSTRKALQSLGL